ncbi:hypothetical protein PHLGIDRAFT_104733 [Phlebiopsis gigantea 11061_1 CR5-6]|uniref:Phospholipid scramblase n=1 Tax=Phlebiopsis gigantea (strain 11061_1 CR5-6) TaxID=745531 RepID=A0A0C3PN29_PHLG1|nr:hypothetical protein PHLGIDRAFT_104733 [Phlebiopsis gigantea 11061_1 CR5-6]
MLASRLAARTCVQHNFKRASAAALLPSFRTYAHSRFTEKAPGSSRIRDRPQRIPIDKAPKSDPVNDVKHEESPSADESDLWQASMRAPASDPEEGLTRLLMDNDELIVTRQIEMMNIFVGFEQSNRYVITNPQEEVLGYIAEESRSTFSMLGRQILRTHRPFRALVMDRFGSPILWLRRPFQWINSRMYVQRLKDFSTYTPEGEPVLDTFAEVQQQWHLWRRKYDLFLRDTPRRVLSLASEPQPDVGIEEDTFRQFAVVDQGFLAWHFSLRDGRGAEIGSVSRAFRGVGREVSCVCQGRHG